MHEFPRSWIIHAGAWTFLRDEVDGLASYFIDEDGRYFAFASGRNIGDDVGWLSFGASQPESRGTARMLRLSVDWRGPGGEEWLLADGRIDVTREPERHGLAQTAAAKSRLIGMPLSTLEAETMLDYFLGLVERDAFKPQPSTLVGERLPRVLSLG